MRCMKLIYRHRLFTFLIFFCYISTILILRQRLEFPIKLAVENRRSKFVFADGMQCPRISDEAFPDNKEPFKLFYKNRILFINDVLTDANMPSMHERLTSPLIKSKKRILSESDFQKPNLGGCPDWGCELTTNPHEADAFINSDPPDSNFSGYNLLSTQESPFYAQGLDLESKYNMSIGFRHDSPAASPYGYTAVLHRNSWRQNVVDKPLVYNKTKGVAWFVSNCKAASKREALVDELKKHVEVDIYGLCNSRPCAKQQCEALLDTEYHFYLSLENSICKDYITEKLWNQGYGYTVIPIVLKRQLVEPYVPPKSFIAFDDYKTIKQMAEHLKSLMNNKTEYMKYFEWREKYEVIFLNGVEHNELERLWGLCQLCRLLHKSPLPYYSINDIKKYWSDSCERNGEFANKLLS